MTKNQSNGWLSLRWLIVLMMVAINCFAFDIAPRNPNFQTNHQMTSEDNHPLGLIHHSVDMTDAKLSYLSRVKMESATALPSSYDLRTLGRVTPVRNQLYNDGWAYASYASLESYLLPTETWFFDVEDLENNSYFDVTPQTGGNVHVSMAYLSRWSGPFQESVVNGVDQYFSTGSPVKHIQKIEFVPSTSGFPEIKQAIMTYGALYTEIYYDANSFNSTTNAMCYTTHQLSRLDLRKSTMLCREKTVKELGPSAAAGSRVTVKCFFSS